ncbi:MAG: VCBS repeat-containing protein [Lewinellaceae bacterium]|nr:VCBS repeat-containing protein [Lewinellaceae bacterium]
MLQRHALKINLLLLAVLSLCELSAQNFGPPEYLSLRQGSPSATTFTDVDRDGDLDIICASYRDVPNLLWIESVSGGFRYHTIEVVSSYATVVFEDVDEDGDDDIALSLIDVGGVAVDSLFWYENQDGRFSGRQILLDDVESPYGFCFTDLDGDGNRDLLLANYDGGTLGWRERIDGTLDFGSLNLIADQLDRPSGAFAFDPNGDGVPDPVVYYDRNYRWFPNQGQGSGFGEERQLAFASGSKNIRSFDFDLDGDEDYCATSIGANGSLEKVYLYTNNDNGETITRATVAGLLGAAGLAAVDMDQDGYPDIVASSGSNGNTYWYRNEEGSGDFSAGVLLDAHTTSSLAVSTTDFDGDGLPDLLTSGSEGARLLLNEGNAQFASRQLTARATAIKAMELGDLNGDQRPDLMVVSNSAPEVNWFFHSGEARPFLEINGLNDWARPTDAFLADIDQDGALDIVLGRDVAITLGAVFNEDGLGGFTTITELFADVQGPPAIGKADLNGDGFPDVLHYETFQNNTGWSENRNGEDLFQDDLAFYYEPGVTALMGVDVDQDGDEDAAVTSSAGLDWAPNLDGQGTFDTDNPIHIDNRAPGTEFTAALLNDDTRPDLVAAYKSLNQVVAYINGPDEAFSPVVLTNQLDRAQSVATADVDGDGDQDVLAGGYLEIVWFENLNSTGSFGPPQLLANDVARDIFCLDTGDIDGDGLPEVFFAGQEDDRLGYLNNTGDGFRLRGRCFFDFNENGTRDTDEPALPNQRLRLLPSGSVTFTDNDGYFQYVVAEGGYQLTYPDNPDWLPTGPTVFDLEFPDGQGAFVEIGLVPSSAFGIITTNIQAGFSRCSTPSPLWVSLKNEGSFTGNGIVSLVLDPQVDFLSSNPQPDSIVGGAYYWTLPGLLPGQSRQVEVEVQIPDEQSTGDTLRYSTQSWFNVPDGPVIPGEPGDAAIIVRCAYDPNDKLVEPNRGGPRFEILEGEELDYTVRFQNTGNDTAFLVRIEDQLDPKLDYNTFEPRAASHAYRVYLEAGGALRFEFPNINLPDSTCCWAASQGFVRFRIKPEEGLPFGSVIENTAEIYFDANAPIVTNTTKSTLVEELTPTAYLNTTGVDIRISPNPFREGLRLQSNAPLGAGRYRLSVLDVLGREVYNRRLTGPQALDIYLPHGSLPDGLLWVGIRETDSGNLLFVQKVVHIGSD